MRNLIWTLLILQATPATAEEWAPPDAVRAYSTETQDDTVVWWKKLKHRDYQEPWWIVKSLNRGLIYLDSTGLTLTESFVRSQIRSTNQQKYGVLDPDLHDSAMLNPNALYRVAIYSKYSYSPAANEPKWGDDPAPFLAAESARVASAIAPFNQSVVSALGPLEGQFIVNHTHSPIVLATLGGWALLFAKNNPAFDYVESAGRIPTYYSETAVKSIKQDTQWPTWPVNSAGEPLVTQYVAIVEGPGIQNYHGQSNWFTQLVRPQDPNTSTPALASPQCPATWQSAAADPTPAGDTARDGVSHTDQMGSIASGLAGVSTALGATTYGSGARFAHLVAANTCFDSSKFAGWDLEDAIQPTEIVQAMVVPLAFNHSYGDDDHNDLPSAYNNGIDFHIRALRTTEVHACGNALGKRVACNENNTIKVGGYNHNNSETLADDFFSSVTSWRNPETSPAIGAERTITDRELPEVAAPSTGVAAANVASITLTSPTRNATVTSSGSSPATALVTGMVSHLYGSNWTSRAYPELTRAAVLASATHNAFATTMGGVSQTRPIPQFGVDKYLSAPPTVFNDLRVGFGGVDAEALASVFSPQQALGPSQVHLSIAIQGSDMTSVAGVGWHRYESCASVVGGSPQPSPCWPGLIDPVAALRPGKPTSLRMVLAWNSDVSCLSCGNAIQKNSLVDFDMVLVNLNREPLLWNGTDFIAVSNQNLNSSNYRDVVASLSFDNSYEAISLSAAQLAKLPSDARIEIRLYGSPPTSGQCPGPTCWLTATCPGPACWTERLGFASYATY